MSQQIKQNTVTHLLTFKQCTSQTTLNSPKENTLEGDNND